MEDVQRELAFLRSELDKANKARDLERMRAADLDTKLRSVELDLMNRITILETELANEKGRSKVDMSHVDSRLKGEYEAQLKKELKALRKEYERYMKHSKEEFMRTYNQKLVDLERALAYEKSHNSGAAVEAKELRIRVEDLRRRISDLEASNQSLGHRASELQINLQDQAASHQSQLAGKEQEIAFLEQEIIEIKKKYEDIYGTKLEDLAEVKVYSGLIVPEIKRIRRHSRARTKSKSRKNSSSSSEEREKKKTFNGHSSNQRTAESLI